MRWILWFVACASVAGALAACSEHLDRAEDPVWGKQPCAHCAMLIGEPPHAAQVVTSDGARAHFDDIGCMVAYAQERRSPPLRAWVRLDGRWIDAPTARYRTGAHTPMDFGFAAAADGPLGFDEVGRQVALRIQRGDAHGPR